jgi:hypothetical protein
MAEMQQRVAIHPEQIKARKGIVDQPLGTMKRWMDQGYFLTRGLVKVRGEMSLTILVYNLKRMMNILGVEALITAVVSTIEDMKHSQRQERQCFRFACGRCRPVK